MLPTLPIANTDLTASAIGLGTGAWGSAETIGESTAICEAYLAAGGNLFDSAHCYAFWRPNGDGQSERTLGEIIRRFNVRERVVICTKGGHCDAGEAYPRPRQCLRRDLIRSDVQESLDRLRFDSIDLYFLHRDDGITSIEEIMTTLNELIDEGRIRCIGASNWSTRRIEEANAYARAYGIKGFCASQVQWSLATPTWAVTEDPTMRHLTREDRKWHAQTQLPVTPYSSTSGGFFSGRNSKTFDTPKNNERREKARALSQSIGCTPTQVALAWLMHQPFPVIPLTSTKSLDHLKETLGSAEVRLTKEQMKEMEGV